MARFETGVGGGRGTGMAKSVPLPPEGKLLLTRMPRTDFLRVTWPDGQYRTLVYDKEGDLKLIRLGVPRDNLDKALNYLWNFYNVYVNAPDCPAPPPPVGQRKNNTGAVPV